VLTFGVIAEGPTDQVVIENILLGYFEEQEDEPVIVPIQPPRPLSETPAGWGHVFKSLERKDYEGALQYNDFLVIQIDTDVQEEPGFDVPKREGGQELSVPERVRRVIEKIKSYINAAFYEANKQRILFAVAVETIECWLLPLHYSGKKAAKTTGCLEAANQALRKADENALSAREKKFMRAYEKASRGYRKHKTLMKYRNSNPSLPLFIDQLDDLRSSLPTN
jgi:hypothetical protein